MIQHNDTLLNKPPKHCTKLYTTYQHNCQARHAIQNARASRKLIALVATTGNNLTAPRKLHFPTIIKRIENPVYN